MSFLNKLSHRLTKVLKEAEVAGGQPRVEWKDPYSPEYNREYAEDCLYHTIGPMTVNSRWVNKPWVSRVGNEAPEDFVPGGKAPRWTDSEVYIAFAGLSDGKNFHQRGGNKGPASGKYGSPLYRIARRTAKQVASSSGKYMDENLVEDCYQNGSVALVKLLQPGADRSLSPFISWAATQVEGAMTGGVGGDKRTGMLLNDKSVYFVTPEGQVKVRLPVVAKTPNAGESPEAFRARQEKSIKLKAEAESNWVRKEVYGIPTLLQMTNPEEIYRAIDVVSEEYRYESKPDRASGNPFGHFSSEYYMYGSELAAAYEDGDQERIELAKRDLLKLQSRAEDASAMILGTKTGLKPGHTITTPDRETKTRIASISGGRPSAETGEAEEMQLADTRVNEDPEAPKPKELFNHIIKMCLNYDLRDILRGTKFLDVDEKKLDNIKGYMTSNQFRFLIRSYGQIASDYPGRGDMREKLNIPREMPGWWSPYEDPEIELVAGSDETWESIWLREGCEAMKVPGIVEEMAAEAKEFEEGFIIGEGDDEKIVKIPINPSRLVKANGLSISRQKVSGDLASATQKFEMVVLAERKSLAFDDSLSESVNGKLVPLIIEDKIDRKIMMEQLNQLLRYNTMVRHNLIIECIKDKRSIII